jgi:uncharacterized SAM-binding protein YcdF (DUF218 family)
LRHPALLVKRRIGLINVAILVLVTVGLGFLAIALPNSGNFLVVDNRERSDAIVITQADSLDTAYWIGLRLLTTGYGRELLLDARSDRVYFGRTQAESAIDFIKKTAAGVSGQVKVCPITADTTAQEVYEVANCINNGSIRSVLLLVDDFHCRRSLAMFSHLLPQYRWSIAAVPEAREFGTHWWRKREWIRTAVVERQHILWWEMVDRWRYEPRVGQNEDGGRSVG